MQRTAWLLLASLVASALAGCQSESARFVQNMAYKHKVERQNMVAEDGTQMSLSPAVTRDVATILEALFGTPQQPAMPAIEGVEIEKVVNLNNLKMAAGPVKSDQQGSPQGLYREHCVHCHGISGDGAGPTAAFLNPYPRDYRLGLYKFKSSKKGDKPTDEDLTRILHNGIPGTAMPSFALLSEQEIDALVDYVKYLSIRGELERRLFAYASSDLEDPYDALYGEYTSASEEQAALAKAGVNNAAVNEAKGRLRQIYRGLYGIRSKTKEFEPNKDAETEQISTEDAEKRSAELKEKLAALEKGLAEYQPPRLIVDKKNDVKVSEAELKEQLQPYLEIAKELMEAWTAPKSVAVAEPPTPLDPNNKEAIARGRAIFYGPIANCFSCHGESGLGDGQRDFYDDWSGEWVEKGHPEATDEYVALGALKPRNLIPRNLRTGIYRGGRRPVDLYWRITNGIEGAQMPAVPLLAEGDPPGTKKLSQQDVWDLITYVRSLPYESISQPTLPHTQLAKEVQ
jgi:mono/diheme cytochrome c family protein